MVLIYQIKCWFPINPFSCFSFLTKVLHWIDYLNWFKWLIPLHSSETEVADHYFNYTCRKFFSLGAISWNQDLLDTEHGLEYCIKVTCIQQSLLPCCCQKFCRVMLLKVLLVTQLVYTLINSGSDWKVVLWYSVIIAWCSSHGSGNVPCQRAKSWMRAKLGRVQDSL